MDVHEARSAAIATVHKDRKSHKHEQLQLAQELARRPLQHAEAPAEGFEQFLDEEEKEEWAQYQANMKQMLQEARCPRLEAQVDETGLDDISRPSILQGLRRKLCSSLAQHSTAHTDKRVSLFGGEKEFATAADPPQRMTLPGVPSMNLAAVPQENFSRGGERVYRRQQSEPAEWGQHTNRRMDSDENLPHTHLSRSQPLGKLAPSQQMAFTPFQLLAAPSSPAVRGPRFHSSNNSLLGALPVLVSRMSSLSELPQSPSSSNKPSFLPQVSIIGSSSSISGGMRNGSNNTLAMSPKNYWPLSRASSTSTLPDGNTGCTAAGTGEIMAASRLRTADSSGAGTKTQGAQEQPRVEHRSRTRFSLLLDNESLNAPMHSHTLAGWSGSPGVTRSHKERVGGRGPLSDPSLPTDVQSTWRTSLSGSTPEAPGRTARPRNAVTFRDLQQQLDQAAETFQSLVSKGRSISSLEVRAAVGDSSGRDTPQQETPVKREMPRNQLAPGILEDAYKNLPEPGS